METTRRLVDRKALLRNRRRTREESLFIVQAVADDVHERLEEVNKSFSKIAIVTGLPDFWQEQFPTATIVEDTETLDFGGSSYDLVLHLMSLHWADDPIGQMVQCRNALKPDGLFLAASFGGQTLNELRTAFALTESELYGGISPRVAPMIEIRDSGALLQRAGFAMPVADSIPFHVIYKNFNSLLADIRGMGEANALAGRQNTYRGKKLFRQLQDHYATHFTDADGNLKATFEVLILTGWKPSADQPQPLRPGSAKMSLADALGASEAGATSDTD